MKTILIDQDGPLADFDAAVHRVLDEAGYDSRLLTRTQWETSDDVLASFGPEAMELVDRTRHSAGFYRELGLVDGAFEAVDGLLDAGIHVVVCTAPSLKNPTCASDKIAWLAEHFPRLEKNFTVVKDKTLVRGDLLVDDKPDVEGVMVPTWQHVRFVTEHHASFVSDDPTGAVMLLHGWSEWRTLLALVGVD